MKKLLLLSVVVFSYGVMLAQAPSEPAKGVAKLIGAVIDGETNQPVEFANIALINPETQKPVDGTVCDDKGKFTLNKIPAGTYTVVVSFIGYESQTIAGVTIPDKREDINLGLIKLSTGAKVLNEVTVTGQKQLLEEKVDRLVYNAENDQTARGGDATDVLKRVPMLSVDLDGNVSMRGSSNIQVLINNKPSTIVASSVADALKQIPADQIKTVEVITSPSAKYDAEGSGGIINIITKKNNLQGLTLGVDAGIGLRGSNLGLNGNYRKGKMGFSLGGWGRANYNINGRFESNQITYAEDGSVLTQTSQSADTRNRGFFGNYNLGWDYDINEKSFLAASVRFGARNGSNYQDNLYSNTVTTRDNVLTESYSLRNAHSNDLSNNIDANLSYTKTFEKAQREFSILGSYSRNNRNNDFENIILDKDGVLSSVGSLKNLNDSYNEETTLQVDYQTPIKENQLIEFGAKDILRKVYSDFASFILSPEGSYVRSSNASLSNNLNYDQNVMSAYLSYTLSLKSGYSFKAGTRYEYTTIDMKQQTEADATTIPSYGALVPSVNLSKKLANGKTVKLSYNRRIQRPSIRFLNPNIQQPNPYSITQGNPYLDPEYTNNYELSYSTFIKGTNLNFSTFWRNTNNGIQDIRDIVSDSVVRTQYKNIGRENVVGVNFFANVSIGKLMLNGGTDVFYSMLDNNLPPTAENIKYIASNEGWVVSYRMFGNYNLNKGWGLQFFGFYRGRQVQLQGTQGGFGIYSLGFKKDFNNKKGSVGFGAENFFTKEFKIRNESSSSFYSQNSLNVLRNMSFRINISYRIGKMSMDAPKRRKSVNNDDLKDGGDGGGMDGGTGAAPQGGGQGGGNFRQGGGQRPGGAPAAAPAKLPAADTSVTVNAEGTWNYTIDSPQGGEGTLILKKEGDKYTGTINNKRFNRENVLKEVAVNGNELIFSYEAGGMGGNTMTISVKAIINADSFTGNMTVGQFGTFPINAKKAQ
jgi:outer membrane receptor protein involved in Fe transport